MEASSGEPGKYLNPFHKRRLWVNFQYVDNLLSGIEHVLAASASKSPFPKYTGDITSTQRTVIEDYIARIRAQMVRGLEGQGIVLPGPRFDSIASIRTTLAFVTNTLEESRPKYMRGSGQVPEAAVPELNGLVSELQELAENLDAYLAQGLKQER